MAEPSEEDIAQVVSITDFGHGDEDRATVVQALKSNGRDLNRVLSEWFEDSDNFKRKYRQQWDESMFSGDRDGPQQGPAAYHVEAPYEGSEVIQGVDPSQLTAPSRPPSRSNNQAFEHVTNWATETAGVPDAWDQGNTGTQEDRDFQEALRISAQEAGINVPAQESGVTGTAVPQANPNFGPATREYYEQDQWAMTAPVAVAQTEIAASKRQRMMGAPAFLVVSPDLAPFTKLAAYLTIIHGTPLARNLFLKGADENVNYGVDTQWWKGDVPKLAPVRDDADSDSEEASARLNQAAEEVRRLMAFLDCTTRSFANIGGLLELESTPQESCFFDNLQAKSQEIVQHFFTDAVNKRIDADLADEALQERASFHSFDMGLTSANLKGVTNLYGLIDNLLWSEVLENPDGDRSEMCMSVLRKEADVFCINFSGQPCHRIDIPEVFYCERWMEPRQEDAAKIMNEVDLLNRKHAAVEQKRMKVYADKNGGDKRVLLDRIQERFEKQRKYLRQRACFNTVEESDFDVDKYPDYHAAPAAWTDEEKRLDAKLEEAMQAAELQLEICRTQSKALLDELERIKKKKKFLTTLLTDPKKDRPKPMSCKKHLLQGVATSNNTVYVCKRAQEDLIVLDVAQQRDQWWRLQYDPNNHDQPVKVETLEYEDIWDRAWTETKSPLLVYATEAAARAEPSALPPALERFVKADNKAFQRELSDEENQPDPWAPDQESWGQAPDQWAQVQETIPFSPSKRKHRGSNDSMNSNRPSLGSIDGNASEDPFDEPSSSQLPAQKRQSPGVHSSELNDKPPPLPQRPSDSYLEQTYPKGDVRPSVETKDSEMKSPEMSERPQASIFLNRDGKVTDNAGNDMDIDG